MTQAALERELESSLVELRQRAVAEGGFSSRPGGRGHRPDSTSWSILALQAHEDSSGLIEAARTRLAADQLPDGRVPISPEHPEAFWPTPLAILAWAGCQTHRESSARALAFLLNVTGLHFERGPQSALGHDTSIEGWPWVANTHSWVEPTALCMLALRAEGRGGHPRAAEAARMLLDRRISSGGWNYGNNIIFGRELAPSPESTGMALDGLSALAGREEVQPAIDYLNVKIAAMRTPLSLGWGLLGLGAWGQRPAGARQAWILRCLERQEIYGPCETGQLALLLVAAKASAGLLSVIPKNETAGHEQPE